jgi:hypothetical protein
VVEGFLINRVFQQDNNVSYIEVEWVQARQHFVVEVVDRRVNWIFRVGGRVTDLVVVGGRVVLVGGESVRVYLAGVGVETDMPNFMAVQNGAGLHQLVNVVQD